ncbi:hypothetical protein TcWFU_009294 [Taenia crassiceps]|uniref:Uncharacterized protein n=1 Tax=Taenia crassiceps TaxID=6207 RepID=A0ABR4QG75_9CEST
MQLLNKSAAIRACGDLAEAQESSMAALEISMSFLVALYESVDVTSPKIFDKYTLQSSSCHCLTHFILPISITPAINRVDLSPTFIQSFDDPVSQTEN